MITKIRTHKFMLIILLICSVFMPINSLHVKGTWKTGDFFTFLAKFGIQKTDTKDIENTQGYIYGNITSKHKLSHPLTLVVVDSGYFMEFYGNATQKKGKPICASMFKKIDTIAFDYPCQTNGTQDFLRKIPCPKDGICVDEDTPENLIPGFQFTYKLQDIYLPRFWYVSLVSCYRNTNNCSWINNENENVEIEYDIWLVNGNPDSKHLNPFEHQFSFEDHDIFECYFAFLGIYIVLLPFLIYVVSKQIHTITKLLLFTIILEFSGVLFNFIHLSVFASNGMGVYVMSVIGNAIDTIAQCLFMLILLMIAKGWTITHYELRGRVIVFALWGIYAVLNVVLFIWNLTEIDAISNIDEWQTWPGLITCGVRLGIMIWFVLELRRTFQTSKHRDRLQFLQQFGAYFLVWFIYLPVLALISTQFSALWKHKTLLTITNGADLVSYLVLLHLLWPSRSILYLIKGENPLPTFELEIAGLLDDDENDNTVYARPTKVQPLKKVKNHNKQNGIYRNGHTRFPTRTIDNKELAVLSEEEEL